MTVSKALIQSCYTYTYQRDMRCMDMWHIVNRKGGVFHAQDRSDLIKNEKLTKQTNLFTSHNFILFKNQTIKYI